MASDECGTEIEVDPTSDDPNHKSYEAHSDSKMESPIKFNVPERFRTFTPFTRLPPELRIRIWENTVSSPGMHFLKISTNESPSFTSWWRNERTSLRYRLECESKAAQEIALETQREVRPRRVYHASLQPLYPRPEADVSYYTAVCKQLARLSVTCSEAAAIANSLTKRPNTLRIGTGLASLDCSTDVFYLEYAPPEVFEKGCNFYKILDCPGLDRIQNIAVRYCHKWYQHQSPSACLECGGYHDVVPDRVNYPKHLYRFMAQYLPNLRNFYFVDYFILRKLEYMQDSHTTSTGSGNLLNRKFEGGNRTYHQVSPEHWNVTSKVFHVQSWLQSRFVKYAKSSRLSKHKNPDQVNFGVLACEWGAAPGSARSAPRSPVKKGVNKRTHGDDLPARRKGRPRQPGSPVVTNQLPVAVNDGSTVVFGTQATRNLQFEFRMSLG